MVSFCHLLPGIVACAAALAGASAFAADPPGVTRTAGATSIQWTARDVPRLPAVFPGGSPVVTDLGVFGFSRLFRLSLGDSVDHFGLVLNYRSGRIAPGDWNMTLGDQQVRLSFHRQNLVLADILPALEQERRGARQTWLRPADSRPRRDTPDTLTATTVSESRPPRGLVVYLSSIVWLSESEKNFLTRLRKTGWNVAAFSFPMDLVAEQQYFIGRDGERQLAARVDNHLTDRAYAVESMLAFLAANRPDLLRGKRVLIGGSAGAIAAPAVAARIGGFDAAVLVGGGANVARIMIESPVFDEQVVLLRYVRQINSQFTAAVVHDDDTRKQFADRSARLSRLDPLRTAAHLSHTPTLMLHARFDRIVPAWTGEELYRAIGEPERWSYQLGHSALFVLLPLKAGSIVEWLDTVLEQ